jgi:hypothetical protein
MSSPLILEFHLVFLHIFSWFIFYFLNLWTVIRRFLNSGRTESVEFRQNALNLLTLLKSMIWLQCPRDRFLSVCSFDFWTDFFIAFSFVFRSEPVFISSYRVSYSDLIRFPVGCSVLSVSGANFVFPCGSLPVDSRPRKPGHRSGSISHRCLHQVSSPARPGIFTRLQGDALLGWLWFAADCFCRFDLHSQGKGARLPVLQSMELPLGLRSGPSSAVPFSIRQLSRCACF